MNNVMVNFTNKRTKAQSTELGSKRVISFGIDWILGGTFAGIPAVLAYAALTESNKPLTSMYQFEALGISKEIVIELLTICVLFGFFYYVIIPWKIFPGQTIGKRIAHLKIVSQTSKKMTFNRYFIRQFIFMILIEGIATPVSMYLKVIVSTSTRYYFDSYIGILWNIITIISFLMLFWGNKHLSLHDHVAQTMVISEKNKRGICDE